MSTETLHFDRVVGVKPEHKEAFDRWFSDRLSKSKKIEGFELEKTEREIEIINLANKAASDYLKTYGRTKDLPVLINSVHILSEGGVEKFTEGRLRQAANSTTLRSIIVDRSSYEIDFALRIFHEIWHMKVYNAVQVLKKENKLETYRSGFSVTSRDGKVEYFDDIGEALTGLMTKRFYEEIIKNNEIFKQEINQSQSKEPDISRMAELADLQDLIDEIYSKNRRSFKSKNEILNLFMKAEVNGSLLPVGKLIEKTFGRGSFRRLGLKTGQKYE